MLGRTATGAVLEHHGRDGNVYRSLRFTVQGERHRVPLGVVSAEDAERELRKTMAAARVGRMYWPTATARRAAAVEAKRLRAEARKARLAERQRTTAEAYSLVRKALQAVDRAERDASKDARVFLREAWPLLDSAAALLDKAVTSQ